MDPIVEPGSAFPPTATTGPERSGDDLARLRAVAQRFEAVFLRELMRNSRDPFGHGGLGGMERSNAERQYSQLLHDHLADNGAGDLGIAEMVVRALGRGQGDGS